MVSVDFQLSAPELAVDECRSAATSRLVIVDCVLRVTGLPRPFEMLSVVGCDPGVCRAGAGPLRGRGKLQCLFDG